MSKVDDTARGIELALEHDVVSDLRGREVRRPTRASPSVQLRHGGHTQFQWPQFPKQEYEISTQRICAERGRCFPASRSLRRFDISAVSLHSAWWAPLLTLCAAAGSSSSAVNQSVLQKKINCDSMAVLPLGPIQCRPGAHACCAWLVSPVGVNNRRRPVCASRENRYDTSGPDDGSHPVHSRGVHPLETRDSAVAVRRRRPVCFTWK